MRQPPITNANPEAPSVTEDNKKQPPTPQELISRYQSQEVAVKVIEDLQNVVLRIISTNKKDKFMVETSRKIDVVNSRVLDSKTGYVETFAIGLLLGL